jgi:cytochrome b
MTTTPTPDNGAPSAPQATALVWDRGVRTFHWLLVICVLGAFFTGLGGGADALDIHVILGTLIACLILFRLIWGRLGTAYARFGSFVPSPMGVIRHAGELARGRAAHHIGHNPIGSAMILALLVTLVAILTTGVIVLGGMVKEGPLAPFLSFATAWEVREVHEFLAYLLMALAGLHVAGVLAESWRTRENLIRAMVTGTKRTSPGAMGAAPARARPISALALFTVTGAGAAAAIAYFSLLPAYGVPDKPLDAAYAKECGGCHTPHHPSLAPAATWAAIMGGLDSHFGENASLDPAVTSALSVYLAANSAEKWDTWPANRLRTASDTDPLRITETRGWKRLHHELPDAVFKTKAVGGKLNCSKCHRDADSGRFAPRAISVPRDTATK